MIILCVLSLAIGFCQIVPLGFVDFPCFDEMVRQQEIDSDTRIVYCISIWPRQAISGGAIYGEGTSNQNEVTVRELSFKRSGQTLFVNNHALNTGEVYKTTKWTLSISPWVLFTRRFEITNEGLFTPSEASTPTDVLYVSGNVYEGWLINPLGLLILGCGIWLFRQGKKELKQESPSTTEAGQQNVHR